MQLLGLPSWVFASATASTLLPIGLGAAVSYGSRPHDVQKTYRSLKIPPLRPPPWVFGPVWTVLYGMMGYAAHRAWASGSASAAAAHTARLGARLFTVQLAINLAWTPLFFVLRRPVAATVDIVALLGLNVYLTSLWAGLDAGAAWCMVPYVLWLSFATYLCAGAGYLNNWDFSTAALEGRKNK